MGSQAVLAVMAMAYLIIIIQTGLFFDPHGDNPVDLTQLVHLLLWLIPAVICLGMFLTLHRLSEHPKYLEKIDKTIAQLRDKLKKS
jgi:hypothetical protein